MLRNERMKLVVPTSFQILRILDSRARQTAPNLAALLDRETSYMSNQLSDLAAQGLVRKVGPSDNSSMYEITSRGQLVLRYAPDYSHDTVDRFRREISEAITASDLPEVPVLKLGERDFELLSTVPSQDPSTATNIAKECEKMPEIVEAGLSYLRHQGLIEKVEDRGYQRTAFGDAVIDNRDQYDETGREEFTAKVSEEARIEQESELRNEASDS